MVHQRFAEGEPPKCAPWLAPSRLLRDKRCISRWHAAHRGGPIKFAVPSPQHAERGLAQAQRLFEHGFEHWREITRRAVDDLQDLGGRGLPLQRLVTLGSALCKFSLTL